MATTPLSAREASALRFFGEPRRYVRDHRIALRAELVADLLGDTTGKRIVDLGCGNGAIAERLPGALTLIDTSPAMIAAARGRVGNRALYRCADLHHIEAEQFDIALCIGVLAHVDDTARTIEAAHRCLRPGGLLVLQLTDSATLVGRLNAWLVGLRGKLRYRPTRLESVLGACAGFDLVECRRHFLVPAGLERLGGAAMLPVERIAARIPWLSRHAADAMLLLRKHHFTE